MFWMRQTQSTLGRVLKFEVAVDARGRKLLETYRYIGRLCGGDRAGLGQLLYVELG